MPITVSGDLRQPSPNPPSPQAGAPCGVADWLDFPLDPPDGESARGGDDFGVHRRRYDGYHAGEDWWAGRRPGFGTLVYSIGHGMVTYAQPLGWGADQGIVILRHVLADGSTFLSFYGHLDPPSVTLRVGDCVARGDQVGRIGRPSTSPHLHFEIRSHMPTEPGGGYWAVDPTLAGWMPPSSTIWNYRMATLPGVQWARTYAGRITGGLGTLNQDTFAVVEGYQVISVNLFDGSVRGTLPSSDKVDAAVISADRSAIYVCNQFADLEAFRLPDPPEGELAISELSPSWRVELDAIGMPTLMPLPGGGVAVSVWGRLFGVSAAGELLWEQDIGGRPGYWTLADDWLILTVRGRDAAVWSIDESGPVAWATGISGRLAFAHGRAWVKYSEGV